MTPQQAAIRQSDERVFQRCIHFLLLDPEATVRACLQMALAEELFLYGNAYGPTPTGLITWNPLRERKA